MNDRVNPLACLAIAMMMLGSAPAGVVAQAPSAPNTSATPSSEAAQVWVVPATPNGQPDLQGYWTSLSFTPFERPEKYGMREFLTDEELRELFEAGIDHSYEFTFANSSETPVYDATVWGLDAWQNGVRPNRRTSQVVDPANGRLPSMTPEAQARGSGGGGRRLGPFDGPEDLTNGVRCLTFGGPPIPAGGSYNNNTFILQGKDHVVIEYEWGSTTRVVALDNRPHLSGAIRPWRGDARGRWDGDSLVIETTNFKPGFGPRNSNAATARMTERFTRIDETTIEYRYTIDDPSTWTRPWTAVLPLSRIDGPMFEYACHEGNNGLVNMLEGSRAQETPTRPNP